MVKSPALFFHWLFLVSGFLLCFGAGTSGPVVPAFADGTPYYKTPAMQVATPSGLSDTRARKCLENALPRQTEEAEGAGSAFEKAAMVFKFDEALAVFADCRAALAANPDNHFLIVAHYRVIQLTYVLMLGLKYPRSDSEILKLALEKQKEFGEEHFLGKPILLFIASAYHYGVGVKEDKAKAIEYYSKAAELGDAISARELKLLQKAQ